jgi:signal transduction histidine kinase
MYTILLSLSCLINALAFHHFISSQISIFPLISLGILPLFSPVVYRVFRSYNVTANYLMVLTLCGFCSGIYYTGGFASPVLFWAMLLPFMAAILLGKYSIVIWGVITYICFTAFIYLDVVGISYPYTIQYDHQVYMMRARALFIINTIDIILCLTFYFSFQQVLNSLMKEKNKMKGLVQLISHDLATPLSIISLASRKLHQKAQKTESECDSESIHKIEKATRIMTSLIKAVREIQAIDDSKVSVNSVPVFVTDVVKELEFMFADRFAEKNVTFEIVDTTPEGTCVMGDLTLLSNQIFGNLISNAIKFSLAGFSVKLTIEERIDEVYFNIYDEGVGIPNDLIWKIFETTEKTSRKGTLGEAGTGFGLPLVKRYVEYFQGNITVASKTIEEDPDKHGTSFHLYLRKAKIASISS